MMEMAVYLVMGGLLGLYIRFLYRRFNGSVSDADSVARIFPLLVLVTIGVITVVKTSWTFSLGLLGALSIVRFRAAIKDPEELVYLFFCIGIGLGLGANQRMVTIVGAFVILASLWIRYMTQKDLNEQKLKLSIFFDGDSKPAVEEINALLEEKCLLVDIRRLDESANRLELAYDVELRSSSDLDELRKNLFLLNKRLRVTFFDDRGLLQT